MSSIIGGVTLAAAAKTGAEILSGLLKIAASPEGLDWIGRKLADKQPAIDSHISSLKDWPDPKEKP